MKLGEDAVEFGGLDDEMEHAEKFGTKPPLGGCTTTGELSQVNHLFVNSVVEILV